MMITKIKQSLRNLFSKEDSEVSALGVTVPYLINDPSTPELVKEVSLPIHPKRLDFWVKGYNRGIVKCGTPQHQAANCYVTVASCIDYMQSIISPSLPRWAATNKLAVVPNAGKNLNAYYDRKHLKFFWDINRKNNRKIFTADSADIVAHELGHAILDAMRPDFWSVQALEIWSFHEAFADITAMLSLMQHDEVLELALKQTNNNIMKPNVISKLAEEMGEAIYALTKGKTNPTALRDATHKFRYIDPSRLPKHAPSHKLAAECHSFGRVYLNAWYTIMYQIYLLECKTHKPIDALKISRDACAKYLVQSVPITPRVGKYFQAAAKTFLAVDRKAGSPYQKIIKGVFAKKRILKSNIKMLSNTSLDDLVIGKHDEVIHEENMTIVKLSNQSYIRLDMTNDVSSLSAGGHDLTKLDLEVPTDSYYEFDSNGILIDEIIPDMQNIKQDAYDCIMSIAQEDSLSDESDTMWEVQDNKLLRTYIE